MSCVAEGRPVAPFVTWRKNGYTITATEGNKYQVQDGLKQPHERYQVSVYVLVLYLQIFCSIISCKLSLYCPQVQSKVEYIEERQVHRVTSTLKFMGTDRIGLTGSDNQLVWQDRGLYACHARSEAGVEVAEDESTVSLAINGFIRECEGWNCWKS